MEKALTKRGEASKLTPAEQSVKFAAAARELGCDDDEAAFDAKLGELARAKVEPAPKPPKKVRDDKES